MIDRDGIEWANPRDLVAREWRIRDEDLAAMPEISRHDEPQVSPQEYECGCVAVTRITDRDGRRGEKPFEMRLALPCGSASCELAALRFQKYFPRTLPSRALLRALS